MVVVVGFGVNFGPGDWPDGAAAAVGAGDAGLGGGADDENVAAG